MENAKPGVGSEFTQAVFSSATHSGCEIPQTILLVEDEARVRKVTRQVLEAAGYHVLEARTASDAVRMAAHQQTRLKILITDVVLPDGNGLDLAAELSVEVPWLKTVFISGYPENVLTRSAPRSARSCYLAKPFSGDSLIKLVQQVQGEN